jgi:hypothetical protein
MNIYIDGTAYPEKIKYIYTPDQSSLFAFYNDQNYFIPRSLTVGVNSFASSFDSSQKMTLTTLYQCVCFSANYQSLYILDQNKNLLLYNISAKILSAFAATPYSGITQCYFDTLSQGIVFVSGSSTMTDLWLFDINALMPVGHKSLNEGNFELDPSFSYYSTTTATEARIYKCSTTNTSENISQTNATNSTQTSTTNSTQTNITNVTQANSTNLPPLINATDLSPTSSSYSSQMNTTNITEQNSKNSTQTNTTNSTQTNVTNSSQANSTVPPGINSTNSSQVTYNLGIFSETAVVLLENKWISVLNNIPGSRKALPFLCFLISIDELWLYQYHERYYGGTFATFFGIMQQFENKKWELLEEKTTENIFGWMGTSRGAIESFVDTKYDYAHPTFRSVEGKGETFLPACF